MDILIGVYFSNLFITIFQINYRFNKILYFYLPLFTIMHTLYIAIEFGNKDIRFLFRNWFLIVCHSEPFRKKNHPHTIPKNPKSILQKNEETISKPFLKEKNTSFEVKIHFETHLYPFHPKIGSRYLQKKNKKRLVNRFLKEKNTSFETKFAQECRVKSKPKYLKKE